jgi:hypothetical protein
MLQTRFQRNAKRAPCPNARRAVEVSTVILHLSTQWGASLVIEKNRRSLKTAMRELCHEKLPAILVLKAV